MQSAQQPTLVQPDENAKLHSQKLLRYIMKQIQLSGGQISFEHYMQLALYAPGLGYYSAGMHKFGQQGDFVTAPEISPLFGQVLAIQASSVLHQVRDKTGIADILEVGAGSGKMAADILTKLQQQQCLPDHYYILELSADLKQRQQIYLEKLLPDYFAQIIWLDSLPEKDFNGLVIANELLDAFPVHLVKLENQQLYERFVCLKRDEENKTLELVFKDIAVDDPKLLSTKDKIQKNLKLNHDLQQGVQDPSQANPAYITEVNLLASQWIKTISQSISCGGLLLIDYGYPESEYLHPQRHMGTLMCHYRHLAHDEPFFYPGLQDITAHINFTDIKNSAEQSALFLEGYTTQAHFLLAGGLVELTQHIDVNEIKEHAKMVQDIKRL
ncbi:MAG: SAM-dependent methyltransferase, partial [Thiotrichaceae bacterium]|nr:SAM-dependent methyltransferase [Thiotrichaceae bacterium]